MIKILMVIDSRGWAIDQLAQVKMKYNPHFKFKAVYVHPRDAKESKVLNDFKNTLEEFKPDIIHFEYYRSCSQLIEQLPEIKKYKIILTHHNQRDKALNEMDWHNNGVDHIVTHTEKCKRLLVDEYFQKKEKISVINHGIDLDFFNYSNEEPEEQHVGYAGRIVPWKGLKEIAETSKELGYPVMFMGKHDKADYWESISEEGKANINFSFMQCKDEERIDFYRNLTCYIGNSRDGLEEGTLEYLEAMACGIPVITTLAGVARDIAKHEENCLVIPFENREELKKATKRIMEDEDLRNKLRKGGWNTVKNMTNKKMAYEYSNLYYKINNEDSLASVIIPVTLSRIKQLGDILKALEEQSYKNFEVIVAFDEKEGITDELKETLRNTYNLVLKFIETKKDGYNLAMARNMAAVEAEGKHLIFLDSRLKPDENAIQLFVTSLDSSSDDIWFFGNKGTGKKSFVENYSAVKRYKFLDLGMFNERISEYGGMSQEIRTRWINNGNKFHYLDDVKAEQMIKASKDNDRRKSIISMKLLLFKLYRNNSH